MRENTKWIMLVTAIAFVGLMVFEWGMDITGLSSGSFGELGRVNGTPLTYDQYQTIYRNLYDQVSRSQDEPPTTAQIREIEEAAWNELVNQVLIQQELARRGIRVTEEEIRQAARFSPPQELLGDPLFETDGQFDIQKYQGFLANADELFLLQLEAYYRDLIPRGKLLRQVASGVYFSEGELWRDYRDQHEEVRVRYLAFDPDYRVADDAVQATAQEVQAYYRERQEDFQLPARAQVKYLALSKAPLAEDTAATVERALALREEILGGADFAAVARRESRDPGSAPQGGDLGTFQRGQMVAAFDSAVFSSPLRQVSEPVRSPFGFHLIEVLSRRGDTAQARHILIPVDRTHESELRLLTMADSLEALGRTHTLDDAAALLGQQVLTQEISELFPFLTGVGQIADGLDWVFKEGVPGEVSPVFEDQQAFYMVELVSSSPARIQSLENARPTIEQVLRTRKKVRLAQEEAQALVDRARTSGTLEAVADGEELVTREAGPFSRMDFVPGLGRQNAALGAAFGLAEGEISDPVVAGNNVFLIQTLERFPADSLAWEEQKVDQRARLTFAFQQQRLQQWIEGLRETARIVDRREQVFQAPAPSDSRFPLF